jgi:peptidyl-prolyl cis-trans isomerase D
MMRQMRENTKWIMLVTAMAFVLLMVFEWGMDITGRSTGGVGEIGSVNGEPVMYEEYMVTYRNLYDEIQRSQSTSLTSEQNRQLEDEAFNQVVTRILIEQELERRGIQVTDEEIMQWALAVPPPALMQSPEFQTNGAFDPQKYQSFVRSPQVDDQTLLYLEAYYRDLIPREKLLRQLTSGVYPSDAELWQDWRDRNERALVRFVSLEPALRIPDAQVTVTADEIRDYYDEHEEDFQTPAQATVRIVSLSKAPLASDTAAARARVAALRQEIQRGGDFAVVAARESADSLSRANGGLLGTMARNALIPSLDTAVFTATVRQVTEPVASPQGLHLLMVERRTADSATVRHLLIPIARTEDSEIQMLNTADSMEVLAEEQGLDAAAQAFGLEVRTVTVNTAFPFDTGAGTVGEGTDWALEEAAPGDVSQVFESPQSFYLMELEQASEARTLSLEEARPTIERVLQVQKKTAMAMDEGRGLVERLRGGQTFEQAASERGLEVKSAGPFTRVDFVPTLGTRNGAIGAAFGLEPGEVSDPVAAASNVFVIQLVSRTAADSASWALQRDAQRQQLVAVAQRRRMDEWLQGIRNQADIEDRRAEVLRPVEETQPLTTNSPFGTRR